MIVKCINNNCIKKDDCGRYNLNENQAHPEKIDFKEICNENNNYKMIMENKNKIVEVVE